MALQALENLVIDGAEDVVEKLGLKRTLADLQADFPRSAKRSRKAAPRKRKATMVRFSRRRAPRRRFKFVRARSVRPRRRRGQPTRRRRGRRGRKSVGVRPPRPGRAPKASTRTIFKRQKRSNYTGLAIRLNAVIPHQRRVLLPFCGMADEVECTAGTTTTYGSGTSILGDPTLATRSNPVSEVGRMSIEKFVDADIDRLQPFGHDLMYTMYSKAIVLGIRFEVDVLECTVAPVRMVAMLDNDFDTGAMNIFPNNVNSEFWCPPYNRSGLPWMKTRIFSPTGGNTFIKNAFTGYMSNKASRPGATLKDMIKDFEWRAANGANPTNDAAWSLMVMNLLPGATRGKIKVNVRCYIDTLFIDRIDRVEG